LKYLKQIYSAVYDISSGYRSQYLNKAYGKIYARRKNVCSQDDTHSQVYSSVVAKSSNAKSGKSGNKYGNKEINENNSNSKNKNNYEQKFKKASGNQAANNQASKNQYAR
jgi:hypothetical protein